MPRKQTRRAISLKGLTYHRIKEHCAENSQSISSFVEELVNTKLDELGVPVPTELRPRPPRSKRPKLEDYTDGNFTF